MAVSDGSWSEHARRRGRTIAFWQILAGCALLVVMVGALMADVMPSGLQSLLPIALLVPYHFFWHGARRLKVESSTPVKPPLVLPAASHPGSFAGHPEPRPAFGIRLGFRPVRAVVYLGVIMGIPMIALAVISGPAAALAYGLLWTAIELWNLNWFLRHVPIEVRVADSLIEWKARLRRDVIPAASLRRLRCNTVPSGAIVLEFEGHRPRLMYVSGGFADFVEALTVTCPWVEVSTDVIDRFGSWSGKTNGFFVESHNSAAGRG